MSNHLEAKKTLINYVPFGAEDQQKDWVKRGMWAAQWIGAGRDEKLPQVNAYRNCFSLNETTPVRLHVTADAKYRLWLDGQFVAMGPEQGDVNNYWFDTYDLTLPPGSHCLVAMVYSFGTEGPYSQMGMRHGFLLGAEGVPARMLDTNATNWQYTQVHGIDWEKVDWLVIGGAIIFDRNLFPSGVEAGKGGDWQPALEYDCGANLSQRNEYAPQHLLRPATLPPMSENPITNMFVKFVGQLNSNHIEKRNDLPDEHAKWQAFLLGERLHIPSGSVRKIIIDLNDYYSAYPYLTVSGGKNAQITIGWAESLFLENNIVGQKGNRGDWDKKYFIGINDKFIADGTARQQFYTHWWRSGRWLSLTIETGAEALTMEKMELCETCYPMPMAGSFRCSDERINQLIQPCLRTLQMCSHDTFMDCPYFEQLMYIGDTRLQALVNYTINNDSRLAEKALQMFAASQLPDGLLQSRYPSRITQVIPTFSLLWIGMLHDYILWRNGTIAGEMLSVARRAIDAFDRWINPAGLLQIDRGWNFVDWTEPWCKNGIMGIPPEGEFGVSGVINWMYAYALGLMAEMHQMTDAPELAAHYRRRGQQLSDNLIKSFWREDLGLFADTLDGKHYSEHTQCLALLSGFIPANCRERLKTTMFEKHDWAETTVYFGFYLFEAYREFNRADKIIERLQLWFDFASLDLKTLLERPEPSRSDCHAWSSHPLFHYFATFLGIRPAGPGFKTVEIRPMPDNLAAMEGTMPHPNGMIRTGYTKEETAIELPAGLHGTLIHNGKSYPLRPGLQTFAR